VKNILCYFQCNVLTVY